MERIDKIISNNTGISRSELKKIIRCKGVTVNCLVVSDPAFKVSESDIITINDKPLKTKKNIYIMLNKPFGVLSASRDNKSQTVLDLLDDELRHRNLFPAGRLDKDTHGLLIITDDGDFAHNMLSPKKHVLKKYYVETDTPFEGENVSDFECGIKLKDFTCLPAKLEILRDKSCYITVREGKFHQVKRMCIALGREVVFLKRVQIGELALDERLAEGEYRELSSDEIALIFKQID